MISISKIESEKLKAGKRILKSVRFGVSDGKESYECLPYGIDSSPIKGMKAIYSDTGSSGTSVIIGYINENQVSEPGETRIFSDGVDIILRKNGNIEFDGTGNFLVKYNELAIAFNTLKAEFDLVAGIVGKPPSTANITTAKADKLKTS